jgi:hypothetical protein
MPSGSNNEMRPLPVAPRYLRRNARRAMGGSVVRGLVELITNSRDSGYRLLSQNVVSLAELGSRPILIDYVAGRTGPKRLVVRDHFEGMSAEVMRTRLLEYGARVSGFDSTNFVRGINARGAKDVAALGEVMFESIHEDEFAECIIRDARYRDPLSRRATSTDRERLAISNGNGSVVTLTLAPDVTLPGFEALVRDLEHHIELRYEGDLPAVKTILRDVRDGSLSRESPIEGFRAEGVLIGDHSLSLPEFSSYGGGGRLRLYKSASALEPLHGRSTVSRFWRSEAGIVTADGRTAHDISFFGARGSDDSAANYLYGQLDLPQIPELLKEFERLEAARQDDSRIRLPERNPDQVTDPDRLGLNVEHPFVESVQAAVRPLIESALTEIQRELQPASSNRVGAELSRALDQLGEQLAERFEVPFGGDRRGSELPTGLSIIPGGLRLELGRTKRLGVYYRYADVQETHPPLQCACSVSSDAVTLASAQVTLEPVDGQGGVLRGSVEVTGRLLADIVTLSAVAGDESAIAKLSVREPGDGLVTLDRDLQFSQRGYTSTLDRRKKIELFADPTLVGQAVDVVVGDPSASLSATTLLLVLDPHRGIAVASLWAESETPVRTTIEATCGDLHDESEIRFQESTARPKLKFDFEEVTDYGPGRRFKWDTAADAYRIKIATKHATLTRLFGPASQAWPGQSEPQTRAVLAEIIADAYVARRLSDEQASLSSGPENAVDPVDYDSYRYRCFEECLMICHSLLTPAVEGS